MGTCLATEVVRARMEHEKNWEEGGWGGGDDEGRDEEEEEEEEEAVADRRTWLRGRRGAAGCRRTARAWPPPGTGPGSQPAAAP